LFNGKGFDTIISVGGGSVIDLAKLVYASATSDIYSVIERGVSALPENILHIAIPTTAGTGSEATHFAVVYQDKTKYSVAHQSLLPNIAIVDPQLTMSMSLQLTATTGLDALAQAIESYWSVNSTDESIRYSRKALELIIPNLEQAIREPSRDSREGMASGAHYAGKAINIAKTTAPHALSYFFTSYFGIPHGHAVALTLGAFLKFNAAVSASNVTDARGDKYVRATIGEIRNYLQSSTIDEAADFVQKIMYSAGLVTRLSDIGFKGSDIDLCVQSVNFERLNNNPRKITEEVVQIIIGGLQ
jgi:alcohol dehydrogenase class IV